jgi:hypothetical protein
MLPQFCFFLEMGAKFPSLYIKLMHMALFIKPVFKVLNVLLHPAHGLIKVAANISQQTSFGVGDNFN